MDRYHFGTTRCESRPVFLTRQPVSAGHEWPPIPPRPAAVPRRSSPVLPRRACVARRKSLPHTPPALQASSASLSPLHCNPAIDTPRAPSSANARGSLGPPASSGYSAWGVALATDALLARSLSWNLSLPHPPHRSSQAVTPLAPRVSPQSLWIPVPPGKPRHPAKKASPGQTLAAHAGPLSAKA